MKWLDMELGPTISHVIEMSVSYIEANYSFEVLLCQPFIIARLAILLDLNSSLCDIIKATSVV